MATPPGDFPLVVPAEDRKTSDHWDFEGKAVCIPLVSSAGHGKADIKRIHFQEGRFGLATTMCALFVKDEEAVRPRYLHLFLSATCYELLVPLMCGATNVTMNSGQLADVIVPVPPPRDQDDVIESHAIAAQTAVIMAAAQALRQSSDDLVVIRFSESVSEQARALWNSSTAERVQISAFLPS
jgi:type I restriction enzyme M protein